MVLKNFQEFGPKGDKTNNSSVWMTFTRYATLLTSKHKLKTWWNKQLEGTTVVGKARFTLLHRSVHFSRQYTNQCRRECFDFASVILRQVLPGTLRTKQTKLTSIELRALCTSGNHFRRKGQPETSQVNLLGFFYTLSISTAVGSWESTHAYRGNFKLGGTNVRWHGEASPKPPVTAARQDMTLVGWLGQHGRGIG